MKKFLMLSAAAATLAFSSCKKESAPATEAAADTFGPVKTNAVDYVQSNLPKKTLQGNYSTNLSLSNDTVYVLKGIVAVDNATMTIEAGTVIIGEVDANNKPGTLVICRHATVQAVGTASAPIIFTSGKLLDGNTFTTAAPGDFGGVILLGQAPCNVANKTIEGLDAIEPFDNRFGGSVANHSSGTLKYVRIEFGGYILSANNEVNGLTLGGVGSGTTLDHIEVAYGKDDSFEFFGGTVNATYLVSIAPDDDNFDFDNGYTGTIQYGLAIADAYATHSASSGNSDSNGIESDNNAPAEDANYAITPKTHPKLKNFTIIGAPALNSWSAPGYLYAARIRRGSEIDFENSIILGYPQGLVFDATTQDFVTNNVSVVKNNVLTAFQTSISPTSLNNKADANGNKRNVWAANGNSYARLTQPFLNNSNVQVNPINTSASPATAGGWGAFNTQSRPFWGNTTWMKYYY
ncbi:hypothetical protein [Mucilaginibacter defluvii]|uniref:T9SS C-terminal target domain-containing protein n=1 Tax=Mucilaginibacter defluvii TaxID=1196019 RepID=A0ABP9FQW7_9SPHI